MYILFYSPKPRYENRNWIIYINIINKQILNKNYIYEYYKIYIYMHIILYIYIYIW